MSNHKSSNPLTRREALRRVGNGFGMMAFAGMLSNSLARAGAVLDSEGNIGVVQARSPAARQARHLPLHERRLLLHR